MFYIKQKNWDKILGYAEEAYNEHKSEIGGMSVMVEDKDGDWELVDVVILKQEISGGNTVLEKDALAVYYTKQAKKMGKKNFRFCWWHSHHTMSAFWSGTDITAIDEFNEGDFSFALVVNLKGEYKFRVSVWKPVEVHEDVELEIVDARARCTKKMKKEVEELCSTRTSTYTNGWKKPNSIAAYQSKDQQETLFGSATQLGSVRAIPGKYQGHYDYVNANKEVKSFLEIVEEVDDVISDVIDGTINYKKYSEAMKDLNKELEKEDSIYRVNIIAEAGIGDLLTMIPSQLVVYTTGDIVDDTMHYGGYY